MKKIFSIFLPFIIIFLLFNLLFSNNTKDTTSSKDIEFTIKEEDLEKQISKSIKATGERYSKTELTTEGHITLGKEISEDILTVYLISSVSNFEFQDNELNLISGANFIPTVIKYQLNSKNNRYKEIEYKELLEGDNYSDNLQNIFPKKYIDKIKDTENQYKNIVLQQINQAKEYLNTIKRDATINIEHVEKDYIDIPNSLVNKSSTNNFPNWNGELERLENGERVVYSTTINNNNNYIFTKSYKDGSIIEIFELDKDGNKIN